MARQRSIPRTMELTILRRWTAGQSLNAILDWIKESNPRRTVPVHTTRSSIARMIERYESPGPARSCVATVHRLRRQAPANAERLEEIQAEYRKLSDDADSIRADTAPAELAAMRARHALKRGALQREEIAAQRSIRLAGLGGAQGRQALEEHAPFVADARDKLEEDVGSDVLEEFVDDQTRRELEQQGLEEPALIASVIAAQEPSESDTKLSRLESPEGGQDSGSETVAIESIRPFLALPFLRSLPWKLTRDEASEWEQLRRRINHWLVVAACHGVPNPPPEDALPPRATPTVQVVPTMEVPDWPLTAERRAQLEEQAQRTNVWLGWLRRELSRIHTTTDAEARDEFTRTSPRSEFVY